VALRRNRGAENARHNMEALRLDTLAAQVVAWHNRHPLARRIAAAQVHAIGYVVLPGMQLRPRAAAPDEEGAPLPPATGTAPAREAGDDARARVARRRPLVDAAHDALLPVGGAHAGATAIAGTTAGAGAVGDAGIDAGIEAAEGAGASAGVSAGASAEAVAQATVAEEVEAAVREESDAAAQAEAPVDTRANESFGKNADAAPGESSAAQAGGRAEASTDAAAEPATPVAAPAPEPAAAPSLRERLAARPAHALPDAPVPAKPVAAPTAAMPAAPPGVAPTAPGPVPQRPNTPLPNAASARLRLAFTQQLFEHMDARRVAHWALQQARVLAVRLPAAAAVHRVPREPSLSVAAPGVDEVPVDLLLRTATLEVGGRRQRLLIGPGADPAVLGTRLWSLPRLALACLPVLLLPLTAGTAWWLGAQSVRSSARVRR
jgi:hypothetical protein